MSFIKRSVLYIVRKKGKTFSLFLLICIIATFLISCFSIVNATEHLSSDMRTSLGAVFYIRGSTELVMLESGETDIKENSVYITQSTIDAVLSCGDIKYYNPINYGFAKSESIEFIPGQGHSEESNMGKITALSYSALATDFMNETVELIDGEHITVGDKKGILISEQLAEVNSLSVGDKIILTHAKLAEKNGEYIDVIVNKTEFANVTILGIFKLNAEDISITPTAGVAENQIYATLDVLDILGESESGVYTGEIDFYITDPKNMAQIVSAVQQQTDIDWATHFIRTNDFEYAKIADKLNSLSDLVNFLLICVSSVSIVVLILILSMRIRGRMQEVGILMAAGISKEQIVVQFIFEVFLVAVAAFVFSYIASNGLIHILKSFIFKGMQPNFINDAILQSGSNTSFRIEAYLKLNCMKLLIIYLCQLTAIFTSTLLASIMIIRLKPKEILSRMS